MWVRKPTDVWLRKVNKDGRESKMADAIRYYTSKDDAIRHHNNMVDVNPGTVIKHNLYVKTEFGQFKLELRGKYEGNRTTS